MNPTGHYTDHDPARGCGLGILIVLAAGILFWGGLAVLNWRLAFALFVATGLAIVIAAAVQPRTRP